MTFYVQQHHQIDSSDIAQDFEDSSGDDQADLLNELGCILGGDRNPVYMADCAKLIAPHLNGGGMAFITALAKAVSQGDEG